MVGKSKLGALVLIAMMGVATAAFAQNLETGTAADTYGWNSPQAEADFGGTRGMRAFGMVPRGHIRSGRRASGRVPDGLRRRSGGRGR